MDYTEKTSVRGILVQGNVRKQKNIFADMKKVVFLQFESYIVEVL